MNCRLLIAFLLLVAITHAESTPVPRSYSVSRQFIVYGPDARLRGAVCDLAERTKAAALRLLGENDAWKTPILINAQLPQANLPDVPRAQLSFSQTGFGLKLQLDLSLVADLTGPVVEREILRAIFLEMMYRAAPDTPPGTAYVEPPDWLLEGTLALAPGHDSGKIADALTVPVASGNILPLADFLRQRPELLDSPSRALYRAYAAALVTLLSDAPGGPAALARYLGDLPQAGNDPLAELRAHFPSLGADLEAMRKHWALAVARAAASERYRLLSCEETERELLRVLRVDLREGEKPIASYALEEFPKFAGLPAAPKALSNLVDELLLLSGRANPLFVPVLAEYAKIASEIARQKKPKRLPARLAELRSRREQIVRRMSAIADYLNWHEATQTRSFSGSFQAYHHAAEAAEERQVRRRDAISVYLDALESQF